MNKIEAAVQQMEKWAKDDSHGYDQQFRWGERGDYDCSAAVIKAWELAGVPVKSVGATYTGNMYSAFIKCGFSDVTASVILSSGYGLKRGDVLLNKANHTAMYCGNGNEVEASINEFGGTTGGTPGDQTGREFLTRPYRNYPWDCVLRYTIEENAAQGKTEPIQATQSERIDNVKAVQIWLNRTYHAGLNPDGLFGSITKKALVKALQTVLNISADGIFGNQTYNACKSLDLQIGCKGAAVEILQGFLVCFGYDGAYIDGIFGKATDTALKKAQVKHGLYPDGIAAQNTFKAFCS